MNRTVKVIAATGTVALALAACSSKSKTPSSSSASSTPPAATSASASSAAASSSSAAPSSAPVSSSAPAGGGATNVCMVLDTGGVDDRSFNQSSWQGLQDANKANPKITISYVGSNTGNDYTPNLNAEVTKGCSTIIAVGGLMGDNVKTAAAANPKQQFAEIDYPSTGPNVYGIQFNTAQGGFLGGYLAASYSKSGVVATFGGLNIPPVTIYMDGFVAGVRYYDKLNHATVKVLGYTPPKVCTLTNCAGKGTFVGNFTDQTAGKSDTTTFFSEGADIVFPVAGSVGLGSVAAAKLAGAGHSIMWVDSNGCVSDAADCKYFIGTVAKGVEPSVEAAVLSAAQGTFKAGTYIGTLANNGTAVEYGGIKVSAKLKSEIAKAKAGIIAGTISVNPNSYPAVK